jgi:hypothetical protein
MEKSKLVWMLVVGTILSLMVGGIALTTSMRAGTAMAQSTEEQVGRYQISAWASYSGSRMLYSGYYVLDTATGRVVDSGYEPYGLASGPEGEKKLEEAPEEGTKEE